jgi:hypothetical protein
VCECIYLFTIHFVLSNTHVGILQLESTLCSSQKVGCQRHHRVCHSKHRLARRQNLRRFWKRPTGCRQSSAVACFSQRRMTRTGELGKRWLKGGLSHFLFCFFPISVPSHWFNQQVFHHHSRWCLIPKPPSHGAVWKCRTQKRSPWISILRSSNLGWFGSTQYGYPYDLGNLHIIYIYMYIIILYVYMYMYIYILYIYKQYIHVMICGNIRTQFSTFIRQPDLRCA